MDSAEQIKFRVDVHCGSDTFLHDRCPNPSYCHCDCTGCKRVWERAGRLDPTNPREQDVRDLKRNVPKKTIEEFRLKHQAET